jgi:threonine dehydratase
VSLVAEPFSILEDARRADAEFRPQVRETPLIPSVALGQDSGIRVLLKLENLQATGSFKLRGALNKVLTVPEKQRQRGVVTASTGNHGAAVSYAAMLFGTRAKVFVPEGIATPKLKRILQNGADLVKVSGDVVKAERSARQFAEDNQLSYVPPYNDASVIAGQATVGLEIARQTARPPDAVFIPLGGGGLSAGVAIAIKSIWPSTRVVACSPSNSAVMIRSIEAGHIVEAPSSSTISDGTAGGVEEGSITFDLCRDWVDEFVEVSEREISAGLRETIEAESLLIEGAAAVAVAGYKKLARTFRAPGEVIIILTGANIARETLLAALS